MLMVQLRQRFGEPSPGQLARIQAASPGKMLAWAEQVLSASSIEELLGVPRRLWRWPSMPDGMRRQRGHGPAAG